MVQPLVKIAIGGGSNAYYCGICRNLRIDAHLLQHRGWVANIALILNLLFTVGVLTALGATLTAPGIAGLVLTIGMAVDTNVIIYERIKEELSRGKELSLQSTTATKDHYRLYWTRTLRLYCRRLSSCSVLDSVR